MYIDHDPQFKHHFSAHKTIIAAKSTTILGCIWFESSLRASSYRIYVLTMCKTPETIKGIRSFIGAYWFLVSVIPGSAYSLAPHDNEVANHASNNQVQLSGNLFATFSAAKKYIQAAQTIVLPHPDDQTASLENRTLALRYT